MPGSTPEDGPRPDGKPADFDDRLKDALAKRQATEDAQDALEARARAARASGAAWRIMIDLVAAVGLCGALGLGLDRFAGIAPLGLILGLAGGFGFGMWLAARRAAEIQRAAGAPSPKRDVKE